MGKKSEKTLHERRDSLSNKLEAFNLTNPGNTHLKTGNKSIL